MEELNYLKSLRRKKFVEWTEEEKASFIDYKRLNEMIQKLSLEIEQEQEQEKLNRKRIHFVEFVKYLNNNAQSFNFNQRKYLWQRFVKGYDDNFLYQTGEFEEIIQDIFDSQPAPYMSEWIKACKLLECSFQDTPGQSFWRRFYECLEYGILDTSFLFKFPNFIKNRLSENMFSSSLSCKIECLNLEPVIDPTVTESFPYKVAFFKAKTFEHSKEANPEEQYRCLIGWIFEAGLCFTNEKIKYIPEYQMSKFPKYPLDHRVDITIALKTLNFDFPILFGECSGFFMHDNQHKDHKKLILMMFAALKYLVTVFHNSPDIIVQLKVYGVFCGKNSVQLAKMIPVFNEKGKYFMCSNLCLIGDLMF